MDFDEQMEVSHFVLTERKCRVCGKVKDLIDGFYLIRKNKNLPLLNKKSISYKKKREYIINNLANEFDKHLNLKLFLS